MPDPRALNATELQAFVDEHLSTLIEEEALLVLANRFCNAKIAAAIASEPRLTSYGSVRAALVRHRATPQAHAVKFVHYLDWPVLLRFSVDTTVPAPVRRAIDLQMLARLSKLALGIKIASARSCSRELLKALLVDPSPRVFGALLWNSRMTEDDLLAHIGSGRATGSQITLVAAHPKWSFRIPLRKAIVLSPNAPKSVAASQLPHLSAFDLQQIARNPQVSVYLKRVIERLPGRGR
ncbi:MAG TPA: hypothetical protein VM557_03630 [Thermoanaerobaculia bacterium]|nr:hypothetical protein [Thermoanaerobaculia bacterium]